MRSIDDPALLSFHIKTFGCQMNVHDSEHIAGILEEAGFQRSGSESEADISILNTCSVRQGAEDRVWGNLAANASRVETGRQVAVCGCMAQRHGVDILRRFPGVRLVFGLGAFARLPELLRKSVQDRLCETGGIDEALIDRLPSRRSSTARAWVPVSHGCSNSCAYCVVPLVRGRERSRPPGEVIDEIEVLASQGVMEVTLLGQNINSYGCELGAAVHFGGLLESVASVPGIHRVKFETSHPKDMNDVILEAMSASDEACEYIHLPVQSGSDRILALMNRGYDTEYYLERVRRARELVEGVSISTDIIVGFPGETERDFEQTLELVDRVKFDHAFMFAYSPRAGTPAFELKDDVSVTEKKRRLASLIDAQNRVTARNLRKVIGSSVEGLIEGRGRGKGQAIGRSRNHHLVVLPAEHAPPESLVRCSVVGAGLHSLRGAVDEVIREAPPVQGERSLIGGGRV